MEFREGNRLIGYILILSVTIYISLKLTDAYEEIEKLNQELKACAVGVESDT